MIYLIVYCILSYIGMWLLLRRYKSKANDFGTGMLFLTSPTSIIVVVGGVLLLWIDDVVKRVNNPITKLGRFINRDKNE